MRRDPNKKTFPLLDRECRKCGTPIHFARTAIGDKIPLDLRAPVYTIVFERHEPGQSVEVVRTELCYVSHFSTCPYADDFHKSNDKITLDK